MWRYADGKLERSELEVAVDEASQRLTVRSFYLLPLMWTTPDSHPFLLVRSKQPINRLNVPALPSHYRPLPFLPPPAPSAVTTRAMDGVPPNPTPYSLDNKNAR